MDVTLLHSLSSRLSLSSLYRTRRSSVFFPPSNNGVHRQIGGANSQGRMGNDQTELWYVYLHRNESRIEIDSSQGDLFRWEQRVEITNEFGESRTEWQRPAPLKNPISLLAQLTPSVRTVYAWSWLSDRGWCCYVHMAFYSSYKP